MFISEEFKQELKSRTDIVDVISSYVHLKRTGRNMQGLCPFHNEDTPSFSVSPEKNMFHCFGCKASGDVITFIMRIENIEYLEAIRLLAQRAGLEIPESSARDEGISKLKNRIYEANREAARFYNQQLYTQQGAKALKYLYSRGLTDTAIRHFGLGYSPPSRFELLNHL
ncbi:MAG: DNA primase, partial [Clostridia bacterium]|nr:DNA primase [Clostridia bacterium]